MKDYYIMLNRNSYLSTDWPHKYVFEVIGAIKETVDKPNKKFEARYFLGKNQKGQIRAISINSLFDKKTSISRYKLMRDNKRVHNKVSIQVIWNLVYDATVAG